MVETEVDLNYFYISLKKLVEKYPFLKKGVSINSATVRNEHNGFRA